MSAIHPKTTPLLYVIWQARIQTRQAHGSDGVGIETVYLHPLDYTRARSEMLLAGMEYTLGNFGMEAKGVHFQPCHGVDEGGPVVYQAWMPDGSIPVAVRVLGFVLTQ